MEFILQEVKWLFDYEFYGVKWELG